MLVVTLIVFGAEMGENALWGDWIVGIGDNERTWLTFGSCLAIFGRTVVVGGGAEGSL